MQCPSLILEGGIVINRGRSVGDIAHFTCNKNLELNGNIITTCLTDGVWSGSKPGCKRK